MSDQQTPEMLYNKLVDAYTQQEALKDAIKTIKQDFTYHEEHNSKGLPKEDVGLIDKSAKTWVLNNFEEQDEKWNMFANMYKELTNYDE